MCSKSFAVLEIANSINFSLPQYYIIRPNNTTLAQGSEEAVMVIFFNKLLIA